MVSLSYMYMHVCTGIIDHVQGLSQVICGNPVRALKARKRRGLASQVRMLYTITNIYHGPYFPCRVQ